MMADRGPIAPYLFEAINEAVFEACELRDKAEVARAEVGGQAISKADANLVFKPLPIEPDHILISHDAFAALVIHNHCRLVELDCSATDPERRYRLNGCGLPLVRDHNMTGHSFRVAGLELVASSA